MSFSMLSARAPVAASKHLPSDSQTAIQDKFAIQEEFCRTLYLERRRSERSNKPLLLVLLDGEAISDVQSRIETLAAIGVNLHSSIRETDKLGWYKAASVLGVLCSDLPGGDRNIIHTLIGKISNEVSASVEPRLAEMIQIAVYLFPNPFHPETDCDDFTLYPEFTRKAGLRRMQVLLKRAIDVVGSFVALLLLSPLFLIIGIAIKCSSAGPAFFRQERVGQYGKRFTFLKFRSMYANSDPAPHRQYINQFINNNAPANNGVYKLTNDRRVTPLGRVLRKTSLDELPQFLNVLLGSMSLVGPRPPLPYESESYAAWHRRRIIEAKPGITGLWQVSGRSRTSFDEMVRLDLKYVRQRSLWLDLKILLQTPWAVLSGGGAY
jgi:lipopolysaccharide/colanic/teichoic acid biosynthesis glycosyltransferase